MTVLTPVLKTAELALPAVEGWVVAPVDENTLFALQLSLMGALIEFTGPEQPELIVTVRLDGQTIEGTVVSFTLTLAVQVLEFPLRSVTVRITVLLPTLEQLNVVLFNASVRLSCGLQSSVEPLSICAGVTEALFPPIVTVRFWHMAVGEVASTPSSIKAIVPIAIVSPALQGFFRII